MKNTWTTLKALALSCWLLLWGSSTLKAQTNQNLYGALQDSIPQVAVDSTSVASDSISTVLSDSTSKKEIWFFDAIQKLNEKKEKSESGASLSRKTWVWYSINGWNLLWSNTFAWSGKLFKWTRWETSVRWYAYLDNPLSTKWTWKLSLWKKLYKGISVDWDYTFTWTWNNVFRVGLGCWWKLLDWSYWVTLYPYNTNGSKLYAKVSVSKKIWKDWKLTSFTSVDFDTKWYYWETEYLQQLPWLAKWVAAFIQLRVAWSWDWKLKSNDNQTIIWWLQFSL